MHFSIITPSFNQVDYLKRCVASVGDQAGDGFRCYDLSFKCGKNLKPKTQNLTHRLNEPISVHHHIQDGGSTDGTADWLRQYDAEIRGRISEVIEQLAVDPAERSPEGRSLTEHVKPDTAVPVYTFSHASEPDSGMYDALNKAVAFALNRQNASPNTLKALQPFEPESEKGSEHKFNDLNEQSDSTFSTNNDSIVAWLNCDEQYLPGTLAFVAHYFQQHPEVDMLFGDYLVVDPHGELLAYRKGYAPRLAYIQTSHLYNLSCALFFRAKVFKQMEAFDTAYQTAADEDFVVRALKAGFTARHVRHYFSAFTYTGNNLGGGHVADEEHRKLKQGAPFILKLFRFPFNVARRIEKFLSGAYVQRFPLEYSLFVDESNRERFVSGKAGWQWPAR